MNDYIQDLRVTVEQAAVELLAVAPDEALRRPARGGWSAKEIIGHLIDSAANNHQRFVRAGGQDDLVFPGYAQDAWVTVQRYDAAPWHDLVTLWRTYNLHLARVMEAVPPAMRFRQHHKHNLHQIAWRTVPEGVPTTLDYLMRDYVDHLRHHLRQVEDLLPARSRHAAPGLPDLPAQR